VVIYTSPTAKGTYLTIGVALMTAGSALIVERFWEGIMAVILGGALIFVREYLKEQ
jgi:hypothetical protein